MHLNKYLQGTKDYMLRYRLTDNLEVIGYPYSYFVSCVDSQKSTSSYKFILANRVISWRSARKTLIATSYYDNSVFIFMAENNKKWKLM